jgi:HD-like signal output (HDOD) protein
MMRILFVDDEPNILDGLRRALRSMREIWHMEFFSSARQALEAFTAAPFDVVVSDMRMPEMDGAALLGELMKRYPKAIRLILSGHSDTSAVMKSVGIAHQFLSKPCTPETLQKTIERAVALKALVESDAVQSAVTGLHCVPSIPALYRELVECLRSEDATLEEVAGIIGKDIGMTTRILQVSNSAFFGLPRAVTTVDRAVAYLGLDTVCSLVLSQGVFASYQHAEIEGLDVVAHMQHGMRTAAVAKSIAQSERRDKLTIEHVFLAGMLHDVGSLVLAAELPKEYADLRARMAVPGTDPRAAEQEIFGVSHAFVGAYLLGLWALPNPIVEAVAFHDEPGACTTCEWGPFGIVHVASCLAWHPSATVDDMAQPLDREYLSRVGVLDRWPEWQTAAACQLQQGSAAP